MPGNYPGTGDRLREEATGRVYTVRREAFTVWLVPDGGGAERVEDVDDLRNRGWTWLEGESRPARPETWRDRPPLL